MKAKDIYNLKKGDRINHKHYGHCTVDSIIPDFGPCIIPESKEGQALLTYQFSTPAGTPLLETSFRLILNAL